ncbi:MAG: T9SS type A sorting domain-containing protein [Fidelibacterota bacterium]
MKYNKYFYNHLFPIILLMCFSTFIFGVEKPILKPIDKIVSSTESETSPKVNIEKIQQLRLLKYQKEQLTNQQVNKNAAPQKTFVKQEHKSWLPNKTPSFLKKQPFSMIPPLNQQSVGAIEILFNGSADTTYQVGDSLTLTIIFSTGEDSASIGGYLDNGDGVLNDTSDFWIFDEGNMWIYDDDFEDENPAPGIYEITFFVDSTNDKGDMFPFSIEGASIFITATDGGGTASAHLSIEGLDSEYLVAGEVIPSTGNFLVFAIPFWGMGMNANDGPSEVWLSVTDSTGAYSIHLPEPGMYFVIATDLVGVTEPQLFPILFGQSVEIVDSLIDVNIHLVEANAWISGNVEDQEGTPISGLTVWAENGPFAADAVTDDAGYYQIGVMDWQDPFGDGFWETMWRFNVEELELWPAYMIPEERVVFVKTGHDTNDPEFTYFTLYTNDASISGTIQFPSDLDVGCFGIYTYHDERRVSNWIDFCDTDLTSPISYTLPVSSYIDSYGEYWVSLWPDIGFNDLIIIPNGYMTSSGATDIDFNMIAANAWFEGQVFSAMDDFPIEHAFIHFYNDSIETGSGTEYGGYFSVPVLGNMWYSMDVYADGFESIHEDSIYISNDENYWLDIPMHYDGGDFNGPHLYAVNDVPEDQGGRVRIQWNAGDPGWWNNFTSYSVWRLFIERDSEEPKWDFIKMVPWHGQGDYSTIVPTLGNATPFDTTWSVFMVSAHTDDPNFFLDSNPMKGFSVDNLHPSPPLGLMASFNSGTGQIGLSWHPVHASDFDYYTIYRGLSEGFIPDEPYDHTIDTSFVDAGVSAGEPYYYVVTATDFNGNESGLSNEVNATSMGTGNEGVIPDKYYLAQNYPNPFNPVTTISFDLPRSSKVTLTVFDILGNEISILVNDNLPAGRYRHMLNASDFTSGIYFYRLDAGDYQKTRKIMILK